MKNRVYHLVNKDKVFIQFIYGIILLNVVFLILESYGTLREKYYLLFYIVEVVSVIIFSIEYLLRLWTADMHSTIKGSSFKKRGKFVFSALGIIDLLAILPFYLPFIFPFDLRIIRILRLLRLLRIFKLGRYSTSLKTISKVLSDTKSELAITLFVAVILLVLSSTLMYYMESDVQPEKFQSIVHSLWWSVATLTTIGYGDVYPITPMGKVLSAIIALIGIGFIALPTGIMSSAFVRVIQEKRGKSDVRSCKCPKCGTEFMSTDKKPQTKKH